MHKIAGIETPLRGRANDRRSTDARMSVFSLALRLNLAQPLAQPSRWVRYALGIVEQAARPPSRTAAAIADQQKAWDLGSVFLGRGARRRPNFPVEGNAPRQEVKRGTFPYRIYIYRDFYPFFPA
jgi:hypothetical protein